MDQLKQTSRKWEAPMAVEIGALPSALGQCVPGASAGVVGEYCSPGGIAASYCTVGTVAGGYCEAGSAKV